MADPILVQTTKRYAYVVTIFGGDGYVPGALTVAHAFDRLGDLEQVDLICLVTEDVPMEARILLTELFTHVVLIDYLIFTKPIHPSVLKSKPFYAKVWTKFHALRLTNYEKICLIDADYLPYRSMISVFGYDAPAAVTEVPTGISTDNIDLSRDREYSPEWSDLFSTCCKDGQILPGIIPLILLYSNNLEVDSGRYGDQPKLTGNFYYGGMNASVMLLQPNIFEFRSIIEDLSSYSEERIRFFYPEQQYLTLRYAFGKTLTPDRIPEINQEFMSFIDPYFRMFYEKIRRFENILSKEKFSVCSNGVCRTNDLILDKADLVQIITRTLAYYVETDKRNHTIGPWTSLGLEFFITEYYRELPPEESWLGFPLLQQKKLWTRDGIDLIHQGRASRGYQEWFDEFSRLVDYLATLPPNPYLEQKIGQWSEVLEYYLAQ